MSSYYPAIHIPITVTSAHQWIPYSFEGTAASASVAASTYTSMYSLASAVCAAVGHSADFCFESVSGIPKLKFTVSDFRFKWATGAHATSSLRTILGFSAADTTSADYTYSTYSTPGSWFPMRVPANDTGDRRRHRGGKPRETLSGAYLKRLTVSRPRYRNVDFEVLEPECTFYASATSTNLNRDFETVWQTIVGGQSFQYCPDYTTAANVVYYLVKPDDLMDIKRPHVDAEYYNLGLEMMRKE